MAGTNTNPTPTEQRADTGLEHLRRLHRQRANVIECGLKAGAVVAASVQLLGFPHLRRSHAEMAPTSR